MKLYRIIIDRDDLKLGSKEDANDDDQSIDNVGIPSSDDDDDDNEMVVKNFFLRTWV